MNVLLGVTGGVAAYKAAELCRELQRGGANVQVVMTAGAEKFVTPLTFASLSGRQVLTGLWQPAVNEQARTTPPQTMEPFEMGDPEAAGTFDIEHIQMAQWADVLVIAPATANTLAKLAHGIADDLLSTIALATTARVVIAPAMNVNMWRHAATQANLATLRNRGVMIVEPGAGYLACGMVGEGRLAEVLEIAAAVFSAAKRDQDLAGETVLVTAGGTREAIDPVRFLGNRSSGRMGVAIAEEARSRGARVVLVTTALEAEGCEIIRVQTAAEMQAAVLAQLPRTTMVVMAAAVADYRVAQPAPHKLKKQDGLTLELVRNDDILMSVVRERRPGTIVIGFAAETERVLEEGRRKLREKGVDAIVANDVSGSEQGFEVDRNGGWILMEGREVEVPLSSKREMAARLLDEVAGMRVEGAASSK